jgi:hypothetical protein
MTTIIPELTDAQLADLPSQAEAKVYRALRDGLPRDFVVFFQVGWILRREENQAWLDFVVCHRISCCIGQGGGGGFDSAGTGIPSIATFKSMRSTTLSTRL